MSPGEVPAHVPVHVPERSRFEVDLPGGPAVLTYVLGDGVVALEHTVVPPAGRGRGVGEVLARAALGWAHGEGLGVVPVCPYVRSFLDRHPELPVDRRPLPPV